MAVDQLHCPTAIECNYVAFTEDNFTGNYRHRLSRRFLGIATHTPSLHHFLLSLGFLFHRFTHLKKAEVEVKVERRSNSCFPCLNLTLNLPTPLSSILLSDRLMNCNQLCTIRKCT